MPHVWICHINGVSIQTPPSGNIFYKRSRKICILFLKIKWVHLNLQYVVIFVVTGSCRREWGSWESRSNCGQLPMSRLWLQYQEEGSFCSSYETGELWGGVVTFTDIYALVGFFKICIQKKIWLQIGWSLLPAYLSLNLSLLLYKVKCTSFYHEKRPI